MKIANRNSTITFSLLAIFLTINLSAPSHTAGQAASLLIDDFSHGISPKWQKKSFKGETSYEVISDGKTTSLQATSLNSASGLFYEITYAPTEYPILQWSWKIKNTLASGDALTREGDDYSARVYVVFPGFFFWQTKALNYIWANKLPQGEFIKNSHTGNAMMIAVESGNKNAGKWRHEQRNIIEDYQKAFGKLPPDVGSIAIMTDTDNTGESATSWYGSIKISR